MLQAMESKACVSIGLAMKVDTSFEMDDREKTALEEIQTNNDSQESIDENPATSVRDRNSYTIVKKIRVLNDIY